MIPMGDRIAVFDFGQLIVLGEPVNLPKSEQILL
jgi:hypothetical protein